MKLSSLTPEQKTRLLAELDGYKPHADGRWYQGDKHPLVRGGVERPYLTSYDAIIPLIQKLDEEVQRIIWNDMRFTHMTPSQLCDAVLIATGKAEL